MVPKRPHIVLDCDPGHDDAVAIVVAAMYTDLLGITTVAGNAPLEQTTYNARVMRDLLGITTPIHSGADRPLVGEPRHAAYIHGKSGLDGADLPAPTTPLDGTDAAAFITRTCRDHPGTWIVPVGPLTNIALALQADPELAEHIEGISLMGGGSFGNRSAVAEFNIWADPEAAEIVFSSGLPLVMAGLDVTHQFQATPHRIAQLGHLEGRLADVLSGLFEFFSDAYLARHADGAMEGAAVHDPLAVLTLTHAHLFDREQRHVVVETTGTHTRGMTVIEQRALRELPAPNCAVLTEVDDDAAFDLVLDAIATFSS